MVDIYLLLSNQRARKVLSTCLANTKYTCIYKIVDEESQNFIFTTNSFTRHIYRVYTLYILQGMESENRKINLS